MKHEKNLHNYTGIVHVINGLEKISGAETALLRIASKQSLRPIIVVSFSPIDHSHCLFEDMPSDVVFKEFRGAFGLLKLIVFLSALPRTTIVCWMYRANVMGALASVFVRRHRLVWGVRHSLSCLDKEPCRVRISIWLNRALSWLPWKILYNSNKARIQHENYGFPVAKSAIVHNGFSAIVEPAPKHFKSSLFVFGHAGRFTWEKDPETLIAAFSAARTASTRQLKLLMAGRGYSVKNREFLDLLNKYGVDDGSVEGLGELSDMVDFYQKLDVFVLSSLSEGFPNVLAEALLQGIPCISCDVGDASLIISNKSGWLVPAGDMECLSNALVEVTSLNRSTLIAKGLCGRSQVKARYSIDTVAAIYDDLEAELT